MIKYSSFLISTYLVSLPILVGCSPSMFSKAKHPILSNAYGLAQRRGLSYNSASLHLGPQKLRYSYSKGNKGYQPVIRFLKEKKKRKQYGRNDDTGGLYGWALLGSPFHFFSWDKKESNLENNLNYLTRANLLVQVKGELDKGVPVVIYGESGAGKTCLAKDFVEQHKDDFFSVLWINADTEASYYSSLQQYASEMGMQNLERNSAETLKNFIKNCLEQKKKKLIGFDHLDESLLSEGGDSLFFFDVKSANALKNYLKSWFIRKKKVLIVYDNLDGNEPFLSEGNDSLFFCGVHNGDVIITSRKGDWGSNYKQVKATDLTIEEIKTLLSQQKALDEPNTALKKVAELLQGKNILTIRLVGSYLVKYQPELKQFLAQLNQQEDISSFIRQLHLKNLEEKNRDLFSTLSMLGYLAPDHIAEEFLNMLKIENASETMQALFNLGLLNLNRPSDSHKNSSGVYSIHRKIQESIRAYDSSDLKFLNKAIGSLKEKWRYKHEAPETWTEVKGQDTHIRSLWEHAKNSKNDDLILKMLPLVIDLGDYYHYVNFAMNQSKKILENALKYAKKLHENKKLGDQGVANIYLSLGKVKIRENCLDEGISDLKKALQYNDTLECEAEILCFLGEAYVKKNNFNEAKKNLEKAENIPNKSSFTSSLIYSGLAFYYIRKMEYDEGLRYYHKAFYALEDKSGEHFYKGHIYNGLFCVYYSLGKYYLAQEKLKLSNKINKKYFPYYHALTSAYYNNLGILQNNKGQYGLAKKSLQRASSIGKVIFAPNHPKNIVYNVNMADLYVNQGKYDEAHKQLTKNFDLASESACTQDIIAWILIRLGKCAREDKKYMESLSYLQQSLKKLKNCFPSEHVFMGDAHYHEGLTYKVSGDSVNAKNALEKALRIYKNRFGLRHKKAQDALKELNDLGCVEKQG